jgi:hypothetical protein
MWIYLRVAASSVLGKNFETLINGVPSILLSVEIGTMHLVAIRLLLASIDFVVPWVVLLLFPSMTELASIFILASIRIGTYEVFNLPIVAKELFIIVTVWLSSQILPIVSIYTHFFVVIVTPWTPGRLEIEYVEV